MKRESNPPMNTTFSLQPISLDVLREKYLKPGETSAEDLYRRVARALASVEAPELREKYEALFWDNLHAGAIGAGRIMSAAGTDIQATLINCFVQPVGDCIQGVDDEGFPGIYEALREAAETMRRGGGVGYDFSRIRPKGAQVKATASVASGPCSYMNVFDQSCSTVESAGARRGAQMGVLRIDHPDVQEFITAKRTPGRWNNFNVSVGVSDAFIEAVQQGRAMAARIAQSMRDAAYLASVELAREKGAFPKFEAEPYLAAGTFASRLPEPIKDAIRTHGIRNSHLLSIAPTGTVSLAFADNASNGIEPPFSWMYKRKKREADGSTSEYSVEDHAWRLYRDLGGDVDALPDYFISALAMPAEGHIAMMEAVQPFVDTAISKTVNIPADYPYDDFKDLYLQAWRARLKGLATYRPNAILGSVLETHAAPEPAAAPTPVAPSFDPMRSVIESRPKGGLSAVAEKVEYWTQEGHKTLYLIVSFLPVPTGVGNSTVDRAIEFFMPVGQSGESQQWITASMRLLSLAARGGFLERALSDMRKVAWDRGPVRLGTHQKDDGTRVPMWHDSEVAAMAYAIQNILARRVTDPVQQQLPLEEPAPQVSGMPPAMAGKKCTECGAHAVIRKDGCDYCTQCGHLGTCG
ncbi:ribonucleotide reductase N-terminal alpha domain-containing protein [Acidovorax sp.]|uniref:ribonucleotide reductase N-terminal alpha domain-containing protein n=1 Tax=Acidovorax sp. TaxID=1872122 RepID=UPI00258873C5|nr:ribonucleotide reductase N-terminal alpha domain-containing protein [Acidovorax sp.]